MKKIYYLLILLLISCEEEPVARYMLTIQISPEDSGSVYPSSGEYNSGDQVSVKATASSNYNFIKWGGNGNGDTSNPKAPSSFVINIKGLSLILFIKSNLKFL